MSNGKNISDFSTEYKITEKAYGKEFIKLIEVEKDGESLKQFKNLGNDLNLNTGDFHTMREYIITMKVTLKDSKEFWTHDNSDIICSNSLQDVLFILAKKFGLKCPEKFGVLSVNFLLNQYSHIQKLCLEIEEFPWKRISYDNVNLHNHAFVHKAECVRNANVSIDRKDMKPVIESGVKDLHLVKTTKATFLGFYNDDYRTGPEIYDRVLSTKISFTWKYKDGVENIDYDQIWETAWKTAQKNWAGDVVEGAYKSSTQFSTQEAQRSVMDAIPEIASIEMSLPNLLYVNFDFSRFPEKLIAKNENRQILVPSFPSAFGTSTMVRKPETFSTMISNEIKVEGANGQKKSNEQNILNEKTLN